MLNAVYTNRTRYALIIASFLLVAVPALLDQNLATSKRIDACFINREHEKPGRTIIPIGDSALHNYSVLVMWLSMLILSLLPRGRALAIFQLTYASLWFHATYVLLAAMKALLFDFRCAGRHKLYPNGISGHYCYFVFVALTAPRLARARLRANPKVSKLTTGAAGVLLSLFAVGAVGTLYRTFYHGYHSPRQIILGTALGIFSHATLDHMLFSDGKDLSVGLTLAVMLANSLTSLALYYRWWPHESAGPAISSGQLVFHTSLWMTLLIAATMLPEAEKKDA